MPGHMLLYKNGNYEIKTYFKTKLAPGQWDRKTNMEQLRNQLAENLKDSVEHHMLSDVEVGAFLSGGVDSGYLASSSGADQAFTVGFDEGDRYSEVNKAAKVAEKAGLKHHVKIISKQEFWDALPDVMYHMDEPLGMLPPLHSIFSQKRLQVMSRLFFPEKEQTSFSVDIIFTENRNH